MKVMKTRDQFVQSKGAFCYDYAPEREKKTS